MLRKKEIGSDRIVVLFNMSSPIKGVPDDLKEIVVEKYKYTVDERL